MSNSLPGHDPALDERALLGRTWASHALGEDQLVSTAVAGDASFRRYFRLSQGDQSWILMDAPTDQEDCEPFVEVTARLRLGRMHAPEIIAQDLDAGFLLLEDLGDDMLKGLLTTNTADQWFPRLFKVLQGLARDVDAAGLPEYDRGRLIEELELFPRWWLSEHHGITLTCEEWDVWEQLCTRLVQSAYEQPRVFVHRDFHSCNLLSAPDGSIGVIDYQDAVRGPLTYDFVSLLWDRYIRWPRSRLEAWMEAFRSEVAPDTSPETWVRWCDWMALQRNLKVVGIFARLTYRDHKQGYMEMIPQFWAYVMDALPRYDEFSEFAELLERRQCQP